MAVEEIKIKLRELFEEELYNLSIGNSINKERAKEMRDLCKLLMFFNYIVLPESDMMKLFRLYN